MDNFNEYVTDLKKLISYKSILENAKENAPFGTPIKDCLLFFLERAREMGFETINYDNYAGEVVLGNGEEVGIIGHLDVVPIGIGWETDPFTLTEKDGIYYGRGLADDKTPLLSCLYALKELKDSKKPINKKFRLIVGCDEESGWRDIDYLQTKTSLPELGFSPDGIFPLTYAEKGIVEVSFSFPKLKHFADIKGGSVVNAVCDYATVRPLNENIDVEKLKKYNLSINDEGLIVSKGKSAHGSAPHLGKNALLPLFEYFLSMGEDVKKVLDYLFYDKANLKSLKTEQGALTLSPDLISQDKDTITITCDCRIPAPMTLEELMPIFNSFGLEVKTKVRHEPMMVEKDGWFVQTLLNSYNEVTGESAVPLSMGGSTFARAFTKGCSFGPCFKDYNNQLHDANENLPKDHLIKCYEIYKKAIFELAK